MKLSPLSTQQRSEHQLLDRITKLMLFAVIGISIIFGAYYFWDRYIHPGDMTPVELGITHLEQIVQDNPDDQNARLSLIQYYLDNENYSEAIEHSRQVLNTFPDNTGALLLLGIAYTKTNQYQTAIDTLEQFVTLRQAQEIRQDTVLETSLYYIGQNHLWLNQPLQAIEALNGAIEIDHTDADAIYLLGNAYFQDGQLEKARDSYLKAVSFVPDFAEAYHGLSECYKGLHQFDLESYAQGMEAYSQKDYNRARKILEQTASNLPDFPPLFLGLALTYEQIGEIKLAQANVDRVLELDPHNISAQNALIRIQSTQGTK
ncbi:MAG: tetratricopeptide repeat protein [Anaerolineales bacterium]